MKKTILKSALMALATVGMLAGNSYALPYLEGDIALSGNYVPVNSSGIPVDFNVATGFDIKSLKVDAASGTFQELVANEPQIIVGYDFQFSPFNTPIDLWNITSFDGTEYAFELKNGEIYLDTRPTSGTNPVATITLFGDGILTATDFLDTPGLWSFSVDQISGMTSFSYRTSNIANPVPEPATMLLFGTGLAGLAGLARRKKK